MRAAAAIVYLGLLTVVSLYLAWDQEARCWSGEGDLFLLLVGLTFLVQVVFAVRRAVDAAAAARLAGK